MSELQCIIIRINGVPIYNSGYCDLDVEIQSDTEVLDQYGTKTYGTKTQVRRKTRHEINITANNDMEPRLNARSITKPKPEPKKPIPKPLNEIQIPEYDL